MMLEQKILQGFSTLHISSDSSSLDLYVDICIRALDIYALKKTVIWLHEVKKSF